MTVQHATSLYIAKKQLTGGTDRHDMYELKNCTQTTSDSGRY